MKKLQLVWMIALLVCPVAVQAYDKDAIVAVGSDGSIEVRDPNTLDSVAYETGYGNISAVVTTDDGNIVIGNESGIELLSGADLSVLDSWTPGTAVVALGVQSAGNIVVALANGTVSIRDGSDLQTEVAYWGPGTYTFTALAVQGNDHIIIGGINGDLFIRDSALGFIGQAIGTGNASDITALTVLSNDDVVRGHANGGVTVCDGSDPNLIGGYSWGGSAQITSLAAQSDDDVVIALYNLAVYLRTAEMGYLKDTAMSGDNSDVYVGVQSDDDVAYVNETGTLYLRDPIFGYKVAQGLSFSTVTGLAIIKSYVNAPLTCGAWGYPVGDLNTDCYVDFTDLSILAGSWLECTDPQNLDCSAP